MKADETFRTDLDGVTEPGYARLLALAVRALNEYPNNVDVVRSSLLAINSYDRRYCSIEVGYARIEVFFKSKVSAPLLRCLRIHIATRDVASESWDILFKLCQSERKKSMEILDSDGIVTLAHLTLDAWSEDEDICEMVLCAMQTYIIRVGVKNAAVSFAEADALVLAAVRTMKQFPASNMIQSGSCCTIQGLLNAIGTMRSASLAASLAAAGAYEAIVAAMQAFPTNSTTLDCGCIVLGLIAAPYFANKTQPRNTEACRALIACLPHYLSINDDETCLSITFSISAILTCSRPSSAPFFHPENGVSVLKVVLKTYMDSEDTTAVCLKILAILGTNAVQCGMASLKYQQLMRELVEDMQPLVLQVLRQSLSRASVMLVQLCVVVLTTIKAKTSGSNKDVMALIKEAMSLYPSNDAIQEMGALYFQ